MTVTSALCRLGLALAMIGLTSSHAAAASTPTGELQAMVAEVNRILGDPAAAGRPQDRVSAILDLVERRFAFQEAASAALGQSWSSLTPAARAEFVSLFSDLVERAFVMALASKARINEGLDVSYRSESIVDGEATVLTTIVARGGNDLSLGYRMVQRDAEWLIADVVLDGVSFIDNYRAQFERVIRTTSYAELIARMHARRLDAPDWWPEPRALRAREVVAEPVVTPPPITPPAVVVDAESNRVAVVAAISPQPLAATPVAAPAIAPPPAPAPAEPDPVRPVAQASAFPTVSVAPAALKPAVRKHMTYWIQAGAFKDAERVTRLESALLTLNLTVFTAPADVQSGSARVRLTRVRVGPFTDQSAALGALASLRQRGYAAFMTVEGE